MAFPCSFSKKDGQLCLWNKIRTKQWLVLGASAFSMYACGFFCGPNATILLVYIPAKIKMSFIWKDDFFFGKIGIFCKSIAGPLCEALFKYVCCTQTYSFGGRIQLITCQTSHELSVTIHEISTSWKKTLDGGPYIYIEDYQPFLALLSVWFGGYGVLTEWRYSTCHIGHYTLTIMCR